MKNIIAFITCFILATSSHAHHEFFDDVNTASLIHFGGTITGLEWTEPHVLVRIMANPKLSSSPQWLVELGSPKELIAEGVDINSLEVLSYISIIAYPSKSKVYEDGGYMYGIYLAKSPTNKILLNQHLYEQLPQVDWSQVRGDL